MQHPAWCFYTEEMVTVITTRTSRSSQLFGLLPLVQITTELYINFKGDQTCPVVAEHFCPPWLYEWELGKEYNLGEL